jgi:hypothetical protein
MSKPHRFKVAAGTPILAIADIHKPGAKMVRTVTKADNYFEYCFLEGAQAAHSPESLYEGGQECGWDAGACDEVYRENVRHGMMAFTKHVGEGTAVMMVYPADVIEVA